MPKIKTSASAWSEGTLFEHRLLRDERFLRRIENARKSIRAGRRVRLEDVLKAGASPSPLGEKVPRRGG